MASADEIRSALLRRGFAPHIAEAFILNFQDESGLNPGINEVSPTVQGARGGYGLAQWTGPRRVAFEDYAASRGMPLDSVDAQIDFLVEELRGPEARAGKQIFSAQDTPTAANAILTQFLRPAKEHQDRRSARYSGVNHLAQPSATQPEPQNLLRQFYAAKALLPKYDMQQDVRNFLT